MRSFIKKVFITLLLLSIVGCSEIPISKKRACDIESARKLYKVQILSNPLSERKKFETLKAYIQENKGDFTDDGSVIRCARALGNNLMKRGVLTFDDQVRERAANKGISPEYYDRLEADVNRGSIDSLLQGEELLWLAEVLPEAAKGNWNPYQSTGTKTRQQARAFLPMIEMIDPSSIQQLEAMMAKIEPIVEDQYVIFALMTDELQN